MKRRRDKRAGYWLVLLAAALLSGCGDDDVGAFRITSVEHPDSVNSGGTRGTLTVHWAGPATFPVEMTYRPRAGGCPPGVSCTTPKKTFQSEENPLVFPESVWCSGLSSEVVFGYEVVLTDADGVATSAVSADFTCKP